MGSQVVMYFFKWVEAAGYGGGGSAWVETHIESFINVRPSALTLLNTTNPW